MQGELFELVNAEVERFGGTTEKFVGDAVLAVFGIPRTHEDDPERAVRAGLAAQERFRGVCRERARALRRRRQPSNRGQHRRGRRRPGGRGTRRADGQRRRRERRGAAATGCRARPCARRRANSRGDTTLDLVRAMHRRSRAKGRASRSRRGWRGTRSEAPGVRVAGLDAPLIGRDEELADPRRRRGAVSSASARRSSSRCSAPPASASRACSPRSSTACRRHACSQGRCLPYGEEITYWPLAEAAKAHAGVLDTDPADDRAGEASHRGRAPSSDLGAECVEAIAWTIGLEVPGELSTGEYATQSLDGGVAALRRRARARAGSRSSTSRTSIGRRGAARPARAPRRDARRHARY